MNPEERQLLERSVRLSEDNQKILKRIEKRARWAMAWGFIKIAIVVVPLVVGYFFLEPYIDQATTNYNDWKDILRNF